MKKLAVLAVAGLMSVTASAVDWVLIGDSESKTAISYVDADSISNSGRYKTAFVKFDLLEYAEIGSKKYDSLVGFQEFDCTTNPKKYRVLSTQSRNGDRVVLTTDGDPNWEVIYPDSRVKRISDFVCSR